MCVMMNLDMDVRRRLITGLLIGAALLCAGYWLRAGLAAGKTPALAALPTPLSVVAGTPTELARVLGAPRPALAGSALGPTERFSVIGVLASASGQGAALISVDKQPPRPFRVGASIAPGFVLKAVKQREVLLEDSLQVEFSLPLPEPTPAPPSTLPVLPALTPPSDMMPVPVPVPSPSPVPETPAAEAGPPSLPTIRGLPRAP